MQVQFVLAGYCKDGLVSIARFEVSESEAPELREAKAVRQRDAGDMVGQLLWKIEQFDGRLFQ